MPFNTTPWYHMTRKKYIVPRLEEVETKACKFKSKYLVYDIQNSTLFNQIKHTSKCETLCKFFILYKCVPLNMIMFLQ